jgi:hypothetical protein
MTNLMAVLRRKFIVVKTCIKKDENLQINNPAFHSREITINRQYIEIKK